MLTLAIDTAGRGCAVALVRNEAVLADVMEQMERGQDSRLLPLIQDVLRNAQLSFAAVQRIAVTRGPGSFTGLRLGLAAAQGLGLALDIPVLGMGRLWIYRHLFPSCLVVIDSKRQELFCDDGQNVRQLTVPQIEALALNRDQPLTGDCRQLFSAKAQKQWMPLPESEAVVAARLAAQASPADPQHAPLPLYIRPPDVSCGPLPPGNETS